MKVLNLTPNPQWTNRIADTDAPISRFVCPLTMKEMNGAVPFIYLRSCGCVFSQTGFRALTTSTPPSDLNYTSKESKETDVEKKLCPQCNEKYDPLQDIFTINPGAEEEDRMRDRLLSVSKNKSKKRKALESEDAPDAKRPSTKLVSRTVTKPMMNPQVAKNSKKVADGIAEHEKKRISDMSDAVRSIYQGKGTKTGANWISQGTFTRVRIPYAISHCILITPQYAA